MDERLSREVVDNTEPEQLDIEPELPLSLRWPRLDEAALHGLAGDIVKTIDPYTEADPVATLLNTLAAVGNVIGPNAAARVQHDPHPGRLFVAEVGQSSKGRKGTAWSTPRYLLSQVDESWAVNRIKSGLSSGEGLIYNVRDPLFKDEPIREGNKARGKVVEYQRVMVDAGEEDKRLLIVEPEFASALTVMAREGNILSAVIRQAYDDGKLSPLTRNNPIRATHAHISIIGHITMEELWERLDDTSKANGFANRFLWVLVKRSKLLPEGAAVPDKTLAPLVERLRQVVKFAKTVEFIRRDEDTRKRWAKVYGPLSEGKPGLLGAVLSRAEAQVLRLSVIYALLDCSRHIRAKHLKAALALWEYSEASARYIFGHRLGDPAADQILEALRTASSKGMSESDIHKLFGGHRSAGERKRALNMLVALNLAEKEEEQTKGRPRMIWRAV